MPPRVVNNVALVVDGLDVSGETNQFSWGYGQETLDDTPINSSERSFRPGLGMSNINYTAWYSADVDSTAATEPNIDGTLFGAIGSTSVGVLLCAEDGLTTGNNVYFSKDLMSEASFDNTVGELATLNANYVSRNRMISGQSGLYSTTVGDTSTEGPTVSLGAATSDQSLYAAFALMRSTGTAITVKVVSSTDSFVTSTTRITFTALSTRGAQYSVLAGPITDTQYRFEITSTAAMDATIAGAFHIV